MVRLGVLTVMIAAAFGATAGNAQRTRAPAPQPDAAPPVFVDASGIVRDAMDRADQSVTGYGVEDVPPVVVLPPVVSRGGVTTYATNGAYLGGAGQRYGAGGSSVVTVQSGASYGYPDTVAAPRYRKRVRVRRR